MYKRQALGYVSGLDYTDPNYQPWEAFQQWKNHPMIKPLLDGGSILSAGARAIVTGGYQSLPKCDMPGALLIGDTAGLLNVPKVKGTHQAIRSGMLAAEHLVSSALQTDGFDAKLRASAVMAELKQVRNIKPAFKKGLWFGMLNAAWETVTGGHSPWTLKNKADWSSLHKLGQFEAPKRDYADRTLAPRDRLQGVYYAATAHDEDQPVHLQVADTDICASRCVVAVSYTHLDVYKRQVPACRFWKAPASWSALRRVNCRCTEAHCGRVAQVLSLIHI